MIALAQMEVIPGQPERNLSTALRMLEAANANGAVLTVFPEFCLSGYLLGDRWEERSFLEDCLYAGEELVAATSKGTAAVFGHIGLQRDLRGEDGRPRLWNAAWAACNGSLVRNPAAGLDWFPKTLLPNYREFDETRHFYDLRRLAVERGVSLESLMAPVALPVSGTMDSPAHDLVGITLCEDGWSDDYGFHPLRTLAAKGAKLLLNLSASPYTRGKAGKRHRVFSAHAKATHLPILYCNCVGMQDTGKTLFGFDGGSTIYAASGDVVQQAATFQSALVFHDPAGDSTPGADCAVVTTDSESVAVASPWAGSSDLNLEDLRCLESILGHFLERHGLRRLVVGASGGIDSACAAALLCRVLSPEHVLLVSMPGSYTTGTTRSLGRQLAENLGTWYCEIPIGASVALTQEQLNKVRAVRDGEHEKAFVLSPFHLENVQARDRSSRILAALASAFGGGFTCNANKAEMTVGYSTLYGDLGGCMVPLGDLWKADVYALGALLNQVYGHEVVPAGCFAVKPTAELNPAQNPEQGGGDPMVYWYHDRLFASWMQGWDRTSPQEILQWWEDDVLEQRLGLDRSVKGTLFADTAAFIADLERWWNLFQGMGVVKRIQAPPLIALTRRAYGGDYRESLLGPAYTRAYLERKARLLGSR